MKKARIVVRETILSHNMPPHTDVGLRALNGIYFSPFETFKNDISSLNIFQILTQKYEKEYEHLNVKSIELQFDTEEK